MLKFCITCTVWRFTSWKEYIHFYVNSLRDLLQNDRLFDHVVLQKPQLFWLFCRFICSVLQIWGKTFTLWQTLQIGMRIDFVHTNEKGCRPRWKTYRKTKIWKWKMAAIKFYENNILLSIYFCQISSYSLSNEREFFVESISYNIELFLVNRKNIFERNQNGCQSIWTKI